MTDSPPPEWPTAWQSVCLHRKLTSEETSELSQQLRSLLSPNSNTDEEDVHDLLEYTTAMISNQKTVAYAMTELQGMEMDFCPPSVTTQMGKVLESYIQSKLGSPTAAEATTDAAQEPTEETSAADKEQASKNRLVSLKSSSGGNALTMAGALGATREGKRKGAVSQSQPDRKKKENNNNNNNKSVQDSSKNPRRDILGEAFDRLKGNKGGSNSRGGRDGGRGRGGGRREPDHDNDRRRGGGGETPDRQGRGRGRGRHGPEDGGRFRSGNQGHRRSRDEFNEEGNENYHSESPSGGRTGRGRGHTRGGRGGGREPFMGGRGRGGRSGFHEGRGRGNNNEDRDRKRQRMEEGGDDSNNQNYNEGYDERYMQEDNYHDQDYDSHYEHGYGGRGFPGRGHGRFGFRGGYRGRGGRFYRGYHASGGRSFQQHASEGDPAADNQGGAEGEGPSGNSDTAEAAAVHPSPLVAAAFRGGGGYRGGYRGRGGRGRWAGRADVKSMIASKTWVRKKEGEDQGEASKPTDSGSGAQEG